MTLDDPTGENGWLQLRLLQLAMEDDLARIYTEAHIEGLKPSYVKELIKLHVHGPMTITELAAAVERTHSALSQKVSAMRAAGLVRTIPGTDARSKKISLTERASAVVGKLAAEWRATEAAFAEIQAEIPYSLNRVVEDMREVMRRKSFHDRIAQRLADDPAWR